MAFKTKNEKMMELVPNNLEMAEAAYKELRIAYDQLLKPVRSNDIPHFGMMFLADWMHRYTALGYKTLCYTIFFVSQDLVPSWLGGDVEPVFTSRVAQSKTQSTDVPVTPKLDLSFFMNSLT